MNGDNNSENQDSDDTDTKLVFVRDEQFYNPQPEPFGKIERYGMLIVILAIWYIIFNIGIHIGSILFTVKTKNIECVKDPPLAQKNGVRYWSERRDPNEIVTYRCSRQPNALIYLIVECSANTLEWETILATQCGCFDELPPMTGFLYRIPENPSTEIGSKVVYKCSKNVNAKAYVVYICNVTGSWKIVHRNNAVCECAADEPPAPAGAQKRSWPGKSIFIGSTITYYCNKSSKSAVKFIYQCLKEDGANLWKKVYEKNCTCKVRSLFRVSKESHVFKDEYNMGETISFPCIRGNMKSGSKMSFQCDWSGHWKLIKFHKCITKFQVISQKMSFGKAKKTCEDLGGTLPIITSPAMIQTLERKINTSTSECSAMYIGVQENRRKTWLLSNIDLQLPNGMDSDGHCLILVLKNKAKYQIKNANCQQKYCAICYRPNSVEHPYRIFESPHLYSDALQTCLSMNGILLPLYQAALKGLSINMLIRNHCSDGYFIGTKSLNREWLNVDGSPVKWTNWAVGEPNNFNENCVIVWKYNDFKWYDVPCHQSYCFVCRLPEDEPEPEQIKPQQCIQPEIPFRSACLLIKTALVTHKEGESYCQGKGGHLLSLHSSEESEIIFTYLQILYSVSSREMWHIGYKRKLKQVEDKVVAENAWTTGQPIFYSVIIENKTQNEIDSDDEKCGSIRIFPHYEWVLTDCKNTKANFICLNDSFCPPPSVSSFHSVINYDESRIAGSTYSISCSKDDHSDIRSTFKCSSELKLWEPVTITSSSICEKKLEAVLFKMNYTGAEQECRYVNGALFHPENIEMSMLESSFRDSPMCSKFYVGIREDVNLQWKSGSFYVTFDKAMWFQGYPQDSELTCAIFKSENDYQLVNENCDAMHCSICEDLAYVIPRKYEVLTTLANFNKSKILCRNKYPELQLAVVWNYRDFKRVQSIVREIRASQCKGYYIDMTSTGRVWKYTDHTVVNSELYPGKKVQPYASDFRKNCVVLSAESHELIEVTCSSKECSLCEISASTIKEETIFHYPQKLHCPDGYKIFTSKLALHSCFLLIMEKTIPHLANQQCLQHRGFLASLRNKEELDFVSSLLPDEDKGFRLLTGLFYANKRWQWIDNSQYNSYPSMIIPTKKKDDLHCITILKSTKNFFKWDSEYNACEEYRELPFICRHNPEFLGFTDIDKFQVEKPKFKETYSECSEACFDHSYFIMDAQDFCYCSDRVKDASLLQYIISPNNMNKPYFNCSGLVQYCSQFSLQICSCHGKVPAFILRHDVELGCYEMKVMRGMKIKALSRYAEEKPSSFDMIHCITHCKQQRMRYAAKDAFEDCFCLYDLENIRPSNSGHSCRYDAKEQLKDNWLKIRLLKIELT